MKKIVMMCALFLSSMAFAEMKTEVVPYKDGKVELEGYFAYDNSLQGARPGVIVVHEWWGHGPYSRMRAEELAKLGYIAFAVDMYGKGVKATTHEEAGKLAGTYRSDRSLMRSRVKAALDFFKNNSKVDPRKIAAIGYCFGGTTVLEMARAGMDVLGVVSFHGGLDTPKPEETKKVKSKVLVLHGADDNFTNSGVPAFQDEMRKAKADWQMVSYGGAVHSFTVKEAGNDNSKGMAYNAKADQRSWVAMKDFLDEVFK